MNGLILKQLLKNSKKNLKRCLSICTPIGVAGAKKMDKETFAHPDIAAYMQDHFYMVKFDAERSDTVTFMNRAFVNKNPGKSRSSHELAQACSKVKCRIQVMYS